MRVDDTHSSPPTQGISAISAAIRGHLKEGAAGTDAAEQRHIIHSALAALANLCCSEDRSFQEIPWCLLALPWLNLILMTLCKCADLGDLQERAQVMVWYSVSTALFIYCRFVWLPAAFYGFAATHYDSFSPLVTACLAGYAVVITLFNVYLTWIMLERTYRLMYAADEKDRKRAAAYMRR